MPKAKARTVSNRELNHCPTDGIIRCPTNKPISNPKNHQCPVKKNPISAQKPNCAIVISGKKTRPVFFKYESEWKQYSARLKTTRYIAVKILLSIIVLYTLLLTITYFKTDSKPPVLHWRHKTRRKKNKYMNKEVNDKNTHMEEPLENKWMKW